MLLSSSLEPNGPKSKVHYIILHHENRRDLVKLPSTYLDLTNLVEELYHVNLHGFSVETRELNICAGERIRIPEEAWSDVAELLGNAYIVLDEVHHSECPPEPFISEPNPVAFEVTNAGITSPDQNPIYQQILACDPMVADELEIVRKDNNRGKVSSSGIKWKGKPVFVNAWSKTDWTIQPYSVFVIRYNFTKPSSSQLELSFVTGDQSPLIVTIKPSGLVLFSEQFDNGKADAYYTIGLKHSMHTAGNHTVALFQNRGVIHAIFDFQKSTDLPRTTIIERVPEEFYPGYDGDDCTMEIGVYEFGG